MAGQNRLYAFDSASGKYYKINKEGRILKRATSIGRIPENSQVINFKDSKYFNRLRTGLPDFNLRRFGATIRNIPSSAFERYMTGNTGASRAFNLAEGRPDYRRMVDFGRRSVGTVRNAPGYFQGLQDEMRAIRSMGGNASGIVRNTPGYYEELQRLRGMVDFGKRPAGIVRNTPGYFEGLYNLRTKPSAMSRLKNFMSPSLPTFRSGLSRVGRGLASSRLGGLGANAVSGLGGFAKNITLMGTLRGLGLVAGGAYSAYEAYGAIQKATSKENKSRILASNLSDLTPEAISLAVTGGLYGLGLFGTGALATAGATIAAAPAAAILGYKAGNLIEKKLGIGDALFDLGYRGGVDTEEGDELTRSLKETLARKRDARGPRSEMSIQRRREFLENRAKRRVMGARRGRGLKTTLVGAQFSPAVSSIRSVFRNNVSKDILQSITERAQYLESLGYGSYLKEYARRYRANQNSSSGFIPNFAGGIGAEMMDIATSPDYAGFRNAVPQMSSYYPNMIKNSAEIEVPAVDVYSRMGFPGAKPKNPSEQYAILNPAQQAALGYAADGFVPNFASEEFMSTMVAALEKVFSPMLNKMSSTGSTSNVINVNDQRTYETTSDKVDGIMEFLAQQFPREIGKLGINV